MQRGVYGERTYIARDARNRGLSAGISSATRLAMATELSELSELTDDQLAEVTGAGWCRNLIMTSGIVVGLATGGCAVGSMSGPSTGNTVPSYSLISKG
jgi:hypothetical protein